MGRSLVKWYKRMGLDDRFLYEIYISIAIILTSIFTLEICSDYLLAILHMTSILVVDIVMVYLYIILIAVNVLRVHRTMNFIYFSSNVGCFNFLEFLNIINSPHCFYIIFKEYYISHDKKESKMSIFFGVPVK